MPPPIPQEVIDSCIDNLAFNVRDSDKTCQARKALLLCSLVSRAFGQRARLHIFSDIRIRPSPGDIRSQQLRDIMKKDPNLCQFIRTLDIHIADAGHKKTGTSKTGLPDILNMLSRSSGGTGIEGFKLHGISNRNPWSRIDKDFLSALVGLIRDVDSDEGSASNSVSGGRQFRTLKSIQISGFKEVPVALITNCSPTIKNMKILYLSFLDTLDAKTDASTLAPAKKKRAPPKPSSHFPLASPPKFALEKFHFTGIPNGNVDSLATALISDPLPFSQLEELDIYPQGAEDLAFVHRVIQSAAKSLQVFKLETRSDKNIEYPGEIDLSQLSTLRVVKIKNFTQYYDGPGGFPPLAPLFAFFDRQTNSPLTLELFEIDLTVVTDTKGMEHAVTDSVHHWDKLNQDLASKKFPHLREVNVSVHAILLHLKEKQRAQVEQKMMESFQEKLACLHSSPLVTVNVRLVVRNDWL